MKTYRVSRRANGWVTTDVQATSPRDAWCQVTGTASAGVRLQSEGSGVTVRTVSGVIGRVLTVGETLTLSVPATAGTTNYPRERGS